MSPLSSTMMAPLRRLLSAGGVDDEYHNETVVDCFKLCLPNCNISFCSPPSAPFPDIPSFPFSSPPAPPPIHIDFPSIPIPLADEVRKASGHITLIALVVSSVLAACFLLLTYYLLFLRCRSYLRRRRSTSTRSLPATAPFPDEDPAHVVDAGLLQDGIHHVWYIRTVGLDEPTIGSITVCVYRKDEGLVDGTDCSVCLSEFSDGELVRLLPKCSHAFHIPCIDTWLRAHVNCPLCRSPIVSPPSASSAAGAPSSSSAARANLDPPPSDAAMDAVDANSSSSTEDRQQQQLPLRTMPVVPEEEEEGVAADGSGIGILPVPPGPSSAVLDCGFRVQSDLGGSAGRQLGDDHWVTIDLDADDGLQHVRRSVSMDSSAMGALLHRVDLRGKDPAFHAEIREKEAENDSKMASPQKDQRGIGRCQSTNGGKFFLTRFARGRSCSVLPL